MRGRRKLVVGGLAALCLVGVGAAVTYRIATQRTGDVHSGAQSPFTSTSDPVPTASSSTTHTGPDYGPPWPFYGRTLDRNRDASDLSQIHPPYRQVWSKPGRGLLEYPPSYANGILYEIADSGSLQAFDVYTGRLLWARKYSMTLSTPAVVGNAIYFPTGNGELWALNARTGHTIWSVAMGEQSEGSPAVWAGRVIIGTLNGQMRAYGRFSGHLLWRFQAAGAVKHGPAVTDGRAYFGDYAGNMYCLNAADGRLVWETHTAGLSSGYRSGTFYATPAVSYGRVYIGNTDDKVYSFVASTGKIAWTYTMPNWAYGSPAVSDGRVFETSFDGTFVALDARTGAVIWSHHLPYRSLASPTVIGPYVYVADLGASGSSGGHVYAYTPSGGRLVWSFPDGKYSSVIAAAGRLVVAGFSHLYVLAPR